MFEEKLGFFPKKKVNFDGKILKIKNEEIAINDIKRIYFQPYNFKDNQWGKVYFSKTGADNVDIINNREVEFTQKQTNKVIELIDMLGVEVKNRDEQTGVDNWLSQHLSESVSEEKTDLNVIKCPNCSSTNIDYLGNNKKSFSVGKAVGGAALTGGIGTLAGFAGKKGKSDKWHCKNCGQVFNK